MDACNDKLRVQIVDDQALVCQALASLIDTVAGIEVVGTSDDREQALRQASELQPDLVLMDLFKEAAVFDIAQEIVRLCQQTKLVLLDEAPLDAHAREAIRIDAAGYLTKQQPFSQLESALRQIAAGHRVFAPEIARRLVLSSDGVRLAIPEADTALSRLTPREIDVLIHLAQGYSVKQCAKILGIGVSTVGNHKSRLMKKLDIHKTVELTRMAIHEGLIPDFDLGKSLPRSATFSAN